MENVHILSTSIQSRNWPYLIQNYIAYFHFVLHCSVYSSFHGTCLRSFYNLLTIIFHVFSLFITAIITTPCNHAHSVNSTTFVLSFSFPSWKSTISPIKHRCRFQKIFHQLIKGFYNFYLVPWFGKMRKIKCIYQVEVSCYCCLMFCIFFNPKVWLEERPYVFIRFSQVYLQLRWLICLKECFF